jgi:squalene synthase HpnD/squalene synthase HpnC
MITASELRSGKTHRDENFPVASWIIHPRHRALILAFYNFVRTADDIADHATLGAPEKLAYLDLLEAELLGQGDSQPEAVKLRHALAERSMPPRHALDVLIAFRMDVTKLRYENWDEVIHYCRYSAMPVGRFMLDVHGESTSTWAASDALCAGLQINNHLQDCGKDYRDLNRVYLPRDALAAAGASVEQLGQTKASAPLLQCLHSLAARTQALLDESKALSAEVKDIRLGVEISVIQTFADKIVRLLKVRDPLSETVHLGKFELLAYSLGGVASELGCLETGGRRMTLELAAASASNGTVASGSSFYAAMRILPREQREAMFQIYSFCRQVDDIADSDSPRPQRLADLQQWRDDIDALYQGRPPARLWDYVASIRKFDLQREDFLAIVDGMEMDVPQDIRAPDLATLDLYCDRVASAVGRLSVRVFGLAHDDGILLAHHLGRALQLTNILRDIDEDAGIGRLYLPREGLLHAGITSDDPPRVIADPALPKVCAPLVERARGHFEKADEVMKRNPRRVVRAPKIMSRYYRAILELLVARGFAAPRAAVRLNKMARIAIVLRHAFI